MSDENLDKPPMDRKFLAALMVVGLIVAAGVVVVIARLGGEGGGDDDGPAPKATVSAERNESSSTCGLPDGDQSIPTSSPTSEWYLNGRLVTPRSSSYGPARDDGGIHSCFSRSPLGATFAAANAAADVANPKVDQESFLRARAAKTAGYEQALAQLEDSPTTDAGGIQIAGFRVDRATEDAATVQLVVRITEGPNADGLVAITYNLTWGDGDWLVVIPEDGVPVSSPVTSLSGYIAWSGS